MSAPRWIIHLPTTLTRLDEVTALAVALRDSLGHLAVVDFGETTLSEEDAQFLRTRVFCDARLDGAGRCGRSVTHDGPCAAVPSTEIGVPADRGHPDFTESVSIRER
ncbi:hypothetical protein [Micromonospora sp. WMMD964]|uniref:hypothetical protein n=1 Tax=Micromonospora sp. WMMD964 TaxID=3016091 RepID=UPI00249B9DE4|nr:hypothetical protein [Micromonospora sp. WMMD964]WFF03415.1 hypothetical protein O7616_11955 [Micromonospora sp. WMMD964]